MCNRCPVEDNLCRNMQEWVTSDSPWACDEGLLQWTSNINIPSRTRVCRTNGHLDESTRTSKVDTRAGGTSTSTALENAVSFVLNEQLIGISVQPILDWKSSACSGHVNCQNRGSLSTILLRRWTLCGTSTPRFVVSLHRLDAFVGTRWIQSHGRYEGRVSKQFKITDCVCFNSTRQAESNNLRGTTNFAEGPMMVPRETSAEYEYLVMKSNDTFLVTV